MLAMVLERITPRTTRPLEAREVPDPVPGQGELLLRVLACAVCRTDLHLVDGELDPPAPLPRIPGHQVVGTVVARELCSVANLTRSDGAAFLARAAELSLTAAAERFPLEEANSALHAVRSGALSGSAVLVPAA